MKLGSACAMSATRRLDGNYVGVDASGESALSSSVAGVPYSGNEYGIDFDNASSIYGCPQTTVSSGNTIGAGVAPNVVSGNTMGIDLGDSTSDMVQGNLIGVDATGSKPIGNPTAGLTINGSGNTIGGTGSGQGNVISGNGSGPFGGILLQGSSNAIEGNYIGTDASGTKAIGNDGSGIVTPYGASGVTGNVIGPGNVISGTLGAGIFTGCSTGFTIKGNMMRHQCRRDSCPGQHLRRHLSWVPGDRYRRDDWREPGQRSQHRQRQRIRRDLRLRRQPEHTGRLRGH